MTIPNDCSNAATCILADPNLICWYAQNCTKTDDPKLIQLPIGLDLHTLAKGNHSWGPQQSSESQIQDILKFKAQAVEQQNKCYANFHFLLSTRYAQDRKDAIAKIPKDLVFYEPHKVTRTTSWNNMIQYKYVISPHGNGLDCHRTWEALILGCIPIVKTSPLDTMFEGLPVLIVKDWSDITQNLLDTFIPNRTNMNKLYRSNYNQQTRVLMVSMAIGNDYLRTYNNLFYESQKKYALKHKYDFKVITEFIDKTLKHPTTVSFNKILVCREELSSNYDFIIFVDADIFINIKSPPIHSFMDYGDKIGIADEYSQPSNERRLKIQRVNGWETSAKDYYKLCGFDIDTDIVLNSGVLVFQPNKHRNFLESIYNKYVRNAINHPRGFHYEQACIGYEIQKQQNYKILDNRFNNIWFFTKVDNTENISLTDFCKQNYFIHFAGKCDYDRVHELHNNL
jgi:hypothetical protein